MFAGGLNDIESANGRRALQSNFVIANRDNYIRAALGRGVGAAAD